MTKIETLRGALAAALEKQDRYLFGRWAEKVRAGCDADYVRQMVADLAQMARRPEMRVLLTAACRLWIAMQEEA